METNIKKEVVKMFERIKAYKNLKKANKFLQGVKFVAEISNDEEMLSTANKTLAMNESLKSKIIFNRKMAKNYNLEMIKHGF
jgi:hypothetical protein